MASVKEGPLCSILGCMMVFIQNEMAFSLASSEILLVGDARPACEKERLSKDSMAVPECSDAETELLPLECRAPTFVPIFWSRLQHGINFPRTGR